MVSIPCSDAASQQNAFQDVATEDESRLRPWKTYWPPNGPDELSIWQTSEFPEVSSWKFDPGSPFDRPWRTWTRTSRAKSETIRNPADNKISDTPPILNANDQRDSLGIHFDEISESDTTLSARLAKELDLEISHLGMKSITPPNFNYLSPLETYLLEKPYLSRLPSLPGFVRTNIVGYSKSVCVYEVSGNEHLFTLDTSGFEFVKWKDNFQDWSDSTVCETYIPRVTEWLKRHLKCSEVYIYAYNFRGNTCENTKGKPWKAPFFRAHCDATAESCSRRLQIYLPGRSKAKEGKRVRFLNIWRALTTPLQNSPLALCDFRTVARKDLVATDIVFPHYLDEAYEVLYNPSHRWFYKQGLESDDMILFKLADSEHDVANLCPHSGIMDPSVPKDTPDRRSIEIRAIALVTLQQCFLKYNTSTIQSGS